MENIKKHPVYYITKIAYYIGTCFEVFPYGTSYKYSLIVYYDPLSFIPTNFVFYLCNVFIK